MNSKPESEGSAACAASLFHSTAGTAKADGRLYYGFRFTTLKDRKKEIGPGLLNALLHQLGLTKKDLE